MLCCRDERHKRIGGPYCSVVRHGGDEVWSAVYGLFRLTPDVVKAEALGAAIGCTNQVWLVNRYCATYKNEIDVNFASNGGKL